MTTRSLLLTELEFICGNCERLIGMIEPQMHGFRPPAEGSRIRNLLELANHLAQIPSVDLALIRGQEEADINRLERDLWRDNGADLGSVMRDGHQELHRFLEKLSIPDFDAGNASAYFGRTQTHAQWLLEIINHLYHHRAQLFTYMKIIGAPVDTRTLYSKG